MARIIGTDLGDNLKGTQENDVIAGLKGADTLRGLAGDDVFAMFTGDVVPREVIDGGKDTDRLNISGAVSLLGATLIAVEHLAFVRGNGTQTNLVIVDEAQLAGPSGLLPFRMLEGSAASDRLSIRLDERDELDLRALQLRGWSLQDRITISTTGQYSYEVVGSAGSDEIRFVRGYDTVNPGAGRDSVYCDTGDDLIAVDDGDGRPGEVYDGGSGLDTLQITGLADLSRAMLFSIEEVAFLRKSGVESNILRVSAASLARGKLGNPAEEDEVRITGSDALDSFEVVLDGQSGFDSLMLQLYQWSQDDHLIVTGSSANEKLILRYSNDIINGGAGDDSILAGDGSDTVYGGIGNDTVDADPSDKIHTRELVYGGAGDDTLKAGDGGWSDGDGSDTLSGGLGNDTVYVGSDYTSASMYLGEKGNDSFIIKLHAGSGLIDGGPGLDSLKLLELSSELELKGELVKSIEILDFDNGAAFGGRLRFDESLLNDTNLAQQLKIIDSGEGDSIVVNLDSDGFFSLRQFTVVGGGALPVEFHLRGSDVGDVIVTGHHAAFASGNGGNDKLYGGALYNGLSGGDGADLIVGGKGNDDLHGGHETGVRGPEVDTVFGGGGNDSLGGGTRDRVFGEEGDDVLLVSHLETSSVLFHGGTGNDTIYFESSLDINFGANLVRSVEKISFTEQVRSFYTQEVNFLASQFNNGGFAAALTIELGDIFTWESAATHITVNLQQSTRFFGSELQFVNWHADKSIYGYSDQFRIEGSAKDDTIAGTVEQDEIVGSKGADTLVGGGSADRFIFEFLADSGLRADNQDRISDFTTGDMIDVSAIDANGLLAGDQQFALDSDGAAAAGEVGQEAKDGNLLLSFNTDNDAQAEMTILLLGRSSVALSDFVT